MYWNKRNRSCPGECCETLSEGTAPASERFRQTGLLKDPIRGVTTNDPCRHRKAPLGQGAVPDLVAALAVPHEGAAGALKQAAQLAIESRRHSRRGYHWHRLHMLGKDMQLNLIARYGEPVFDRDLGGDLENP